MGGMEEKAAAGDRLPEEFAEVVSAVVHSRIPSSPTRAPGSHGIRRSVRGLRLLMVADLSEKGGRGWCLASPLE
jgi:hypothetical protein